jgi:type II secretory pathway component PulF
MPRFEYRALRPTGTEIAGELIAADERDAAARLQAAGLPDRDQRAGWAQLIARRRGGSRRLSRATSSSSPGS